MTSPAKVTREHRAIVQAARFPTSMTQDEREWIATGETRDTGAVGFPLAAQLVADAEERGRAAERADAIAHAREHARTGGADMVGRMTGDLLLAFANELRDGEHVGAAERAKGG